MKAANAGADAFEPLIQPLYVVALPGAPSRGRLAGGAQTCRTVVRPVASPSAARPTRLHASSQPQICVLDCVHGFWRLLAAHSGAVPLPAAWVHVRQPNVDARNPFAWVPKAMPGLFGRR